MSDEQTIQPCPVCGQRQRAIVHRMLGGWTSYEGVEREERETVIAERDAALRQRDEAIEMLTRARYAIDSWSTADLDRLIDEIDALLGRLGDGATGAAKEAP